MTESTISTWNEIPELALVKIFEFLPKHDQFVASTACVHWRNVFLQKRFFRDIKFRLAISNDRQCLFFRETLCYLIKELIIVFDFVNIYHVEKIRRILYKAACCDNIQAIRFETNNAGLLPPGDICDSNLVNIEHIFVQPIKVFLSRKNNPCRVLDLGGIEAITYYGVELIKAITKPQEVNILTLASVKYDPSHYPILTVESSWFEKFTALKVFSIDYDSLNEELLQALQILPLKKFLIVVHGLDRNHPGISETAWTEFSKHFTDIELYLSLIYAFEAVEVLQVRLFRRNMPITHFRVLFCDFMNVDALDWMSIHNNNTLKSVKWIDSAYKQNGKNVMELFLRSGQDPFVMMAWRCKNLEEIVVHGYVMDPHNIVGISRLRGRTLKHLEISMIDTTPPEPSMDSFIEPKRIHNILQNILSWKKVRLKSTAGLLNIRALQQGNQPLRSGFLSLNKAEHLDIRRSGILKRQLNFSK